MFRYPVVIGGGTPFLPPVTEHVSLALIETRTLGSHVVYERDRRVHEDADRHLASRAIDALKRRRPEPPADRRREIRAVQDDMGRSRGDAARVRAGIETTGYGPVGATWAGDRS